ncbi:MAG: hypothetical protein AAF745_13665, partial [Planctomycetota bacterium]
APFTGAKLSGFELDDLSTDPHETKDVAEQHPEQRDQLKRIARDLFAQLQKEGPDWPETAAYWNRVR